MKKRIIALLLVVSLVGVLFAAGQAEASGPTAAKPLVLRYAHMNPASSPNGLQATYFADKIAEKTGGAIKIEVYPASQLGSISEMAEAVSMGSIAMHHNTYGGLQPLLNDLGLFDTPYLYRDVDHLLKATDPETSPALKELNQKLIDTRGVRILYSFYFGTRELTANHAVYSPKDLAGKKIRAIPSPIYLAAVEGMGAVAVPIDWAEVPVALSTGVADGQENPVSTLVTSNIYEVQKFAMMTDHIMGSEPVVINEKVWQGLSAEHKKIFTEVARETRDWASNYVLQNEAKDVQTLKDKGMKIITKADGLKVDEFRASVSKVVNDRFGAAWGKYYEMIAAVK
ncbi:MAG: TRAP transporter substrate-binding protein [Sphaerochaeta sp.]|jgi:tripartite ATP-independent transporter DctP family solute receptor|uniref:TRAP transporter substrate-binding protein n=1 Tax=Sphaerochaeta associata TaxID=1129264 RepID=A0ABY4DCL6_9SPIR|nr:MULTISPECIES: TRAP transporter substrate-binding protein [Sphaerochaeta]MDD4039135.1 TRAP transporter substrate-binding protein [Sphaerochaeta sp.]MDX9984029.1 TRAP transporter substrate-binding protein [Sphaerochaeta sp.]UOM51208.1 TRAP transporter substrate-binding protein [Sphaerochaeta associata]SMP50500.1 tripartite ATP-independent transporter solute receptor, DctP family [Sphaerochaeta associata]